jgi:hypothetical protein
MTIVVSSYRANTMEHLPWRLLTVKGLVNLAELFLYDINELPSFAMTNYARDDFLMISAYVFYMFNIEGVVLFYLETLRRQDEIHPGQAAAT